MKRGALLNRIVRALLAGGALGVAAVPVAAQEVVQALPDPAEAELAAALRQLSSSPQALDPLLAAAHASIQLGDLDAAAGFLSRAGLVAPGDGRVLAGQAELVLRQGDAVEALRLYAAADAAGVPTAAGQAADRGLAHDLVGDNARAQGFYRQALAAGEDAETIRRLALSQAIAGDSAGAEVTLLPLLQRQDRAAYRTRAFALAILGREEEALAISEAMLPPRTAVRLAPYLRYMPRLTRAQQAAAANLGRFPTAAQIGRDDPRLAAIGIDAPVAPAAAPATVDARLIPDGPALGNPAAELPPLAAATPPAGEQPAPEAPSESLPEPLPEALAVAPPEPEQPLPVVVAALDTPLPDPPRTDPPRPAPEPAFVAQAVTQDVAAPEPAFAPTPEPAPEPAPMGLAEAFADLLREEAGPRPPLAIGAVDITSFEAPRERAAPPPPPPRPPAPPPPPPHPARHWVQLATGSDLAAFRYDWRRLAREADGLLDQRDAYYARWGQTRRLLTGPFPSASAANAFVTRLGEAGVNAFRFSSTPGEEVVRLP